MCSRILTAIAGVIAIAAGAGAQPRQFTPMGGGSSDRGKCTVDVVVDGVADVEIRGGTAVLRNVSGQPPYWRRFQCTGPLPPNVADFRFDPQEGRGRQTLIRDPREGGPVVVRIEDPQGGSEGYKFDIYWGAGYGPGPGPVPGRDWDRDNRGRRFSADQAIRVCQDYVRDQASARFRTDDVHFRRIAIDDNPGRNDWVVGVIDVRRFGREDAFRFACSVNFDTGRVRSADIQPFEGRRDYDDRGGGASAQALQNCQGAVQDRLRHDGYRRIEFGSVNVDDRPGRNDWVIGDVRADGRPLTFSCSVDLRDGDVRSVDVRRR
jgi:hypothetical protein